MVKFAAITSIAALIAAQAVSALPRPDSSSGEEVGVSAPDGIPITNTKELAS
jgi:hypothetical protein